MQFGMVGLGRMGANIVRRLMRDGHDCVVYDVSAAGGRRAARPRAPWRSGSLDDFVAKLTPPRAAWLMVPAALTGDTVDALAAPGWPRATSSSTAATPTTATTSSARRPLQPRGIHYVDVGTSGGVCGLERGYLPDDRRRGATVVERLDPIFAHARPRRRRRAPHAGPRAATRHRPSRATCTAAPPAPATSSRWSTTASSTGSWPPTPRA